MRFFCDGRQFDTAVMTDLNISQGEFFGNRVLGLFLTEKSHRVFIWTQSVDTEVGEVWYEATSDEVANFAQRYRIRKLQKLVAHWG